MMEKKCFLRETKIKLLDGEEYSFRALPVSKSTMRIIRAIVGEDSSEVDMLDAMLEGFEKSLSYDQDAETIEYILENGLIPMSPQGEGKEIHDAVMNALIAGIKGDG